MAPDQQDEGSGRKRKPADRTVAGKAKSKKSVKLSSIKITLFSSSKTARSKKLEWLKIDIDGLENILKAFVVSVIKLKSSMFSKPVSSVLGGLVKLVGAVVSKFKSSPSEHEITNSLDVLAFDEQEEEEFDNFPEAE